MEVMSALSQSQQWTNTETHPVGPIPQPFPDYCSVSSSSPSPPPQVGQSTAQASLSTPILTPLSSSQLRLSPPHDKPATANGHVVSSEQRHLRPPSSPRFDHLAASSSQNGPTLKADTRPSLTSKFPNRNEKTQVQHASLPVSETAPITPISTQEAKGTIAPVLCSPAVADPSIVLSVTESRPSKQTASQQSLTRSLVGYPEADPVVWISRTVQPDAMIKQQWENGLRKRLDNKLNILHSTWTSSLSMATSVSRGKLTPTLIIACTSSEDRRKIRHELNDGGFRHMSLKKRFRKAGIDILIVLDCATGLTGLDTLQSAPPLAALTSSGLELEIDSRDSSQPLHGRQIRLVGQPSAYATFGGLIKIENKLYGLTVGHPFAPHIGKEFEVSTFHPPPNEFANKGSGLDSSSDSDSESETFEDSTRSSIWSNVQVPQDTASDPDLDLGTASSDHDRIPLNPVTPVTYHQLGRITALGWQHSRYHLFTSNYTPTQPRLEDLPSASDWALIELSESFAKNMLYLAERPIQLQDFSTSSLFQSDLLSHGRRDSHAENELYGEPTSSQEPEQVQQKFTYNPEQSGTPITSADIVKFRGSKSGIHCGILNTIGTDVGFDGFSYDTLNIHISKKLENGDSGSWVFRLMQSEKFHVNALISIDSVFLEAVGMVIAGGGILPLAYLLPIDHVIRDINVSLGVSATVPSLEDVFVLGARMRAMSLMPPTEAVVPTNLTMAKMSDATVMVSRSDNFSETCETFLVPLASPTAVTRPIASDMSPIRTSSFAAQSKDQSEKQMSRRSSSNIYNEENSRLREMDSGIAIHSVIPQSNSSKKGPEVSKLLPGKGDTIEPIPPRSIELNAYSNPMDRQQDLEKRVLRNTPLTNQTLEESRSPHSDATSRSFEREQLLDAFAPRLKALVEAFPYIEHRWRWPLFPLTSAYHEIERLVLWQHLTIESRLIVNNPELESTINRTMNTAIEEVEDLANLFQVNFGRSRQERRFTGPYRALKRFILAPLGKSDTQK